MKKTFPKSYLKHSRGERGVALLFALGILSVILVAVLIFSSRAMTNRKVAAAYANSTAAKQLAQTAMARALLTLQKNAQNASKAYSGISGDNDFDWLWKLETDEISLGNSCPVRWQYVHENPTEGTSPIIGRFAYISVGENRMDINAIADHTLCQVTATGAAATCDGTVCAKHLGISAAELNYPEKFKNSAGDEITARPAAITPAAVKALEANKRTSPESLFSNLYSAATLEEFNKFNEYFTVSTSLARKEPDAWFGGDINSDGKKDKAEYYRRFYLRRGASSAEDGITPWKDLTVATIAQAPEKFYNSEGNPISEINSTNIIPWFQNWGDTTGNWANVQTKRDQILANLINYNSPEDRAVESDKTPSAWSATEVPAYTGNKRTKYLNEVVVDVSAAGIEGERTDGPKNEDGSVRYYCWNNPQYNLEFSIKSELVNIYGDTVLSGNNYSVKFFGTVEVQYRINQYNDSGVTSVAASSSELPNICTFDLGAMGGSHVNYTDIAANPGYQILIQKDSGGNAFIKKTDIKAGGFADASQTPDFTQFFKIEKVSVKNLKAIVYRTDTSENVDYSVLQAETDVCEKDLEVNLTSSAKYLFRADFQTDDPRQNLHAQEWTGEAANTIDEPFSVTGSTLGSVNATVTIKQGDPNQDPETGITDPAWIGNAKNQHLSTAYIRHAPMQSAWELGAIHRAAPWQTINLHKPVTLPVTNIATNVASEFGGDYKNGDFRLLDQVTMHRDSMKPFGFINLNADFSTNSRHYSFTTLLNGLPFHSNGVYDSDLETSKVTISDSTLTDEAAKLYKLTNDGNQQLFRRSDVFATEDTNFWNLFQSVAGTGLDTDALQEQLIARILPLTKAETHFDSAVVVVIAQSIKDVGGTVYKDWNENGNLEQADNTTGALNAGYRRFKDSSPLAASVFGSYNLPAAQISAAIGQYDNGADVITGETKLTAYLIFDNVLGKWKMVKVKNEE